MSFEKMRNYVCYYEESDGEYNLWNLRTNKTKITKTLDKDKNNTFMILKGYDTTTDGLLKFVKDFQEWNVQLRSVGLYYSKYFCHRSATMLLFKRYCGHEKSNFNHFDTYKVKFSNMEDINKDEASLINLTYNAGLIYFDGVEETVETYGYDFKCYYPFLHSKTDLKIPKKQGQHIHLKKLPSNIKHGFYHIKISSTNEDFKKVFTINKKNWYTNYCLSFAIKYQDMFNITFELISDNKPNAYLYEDKDLIYTSAIFEKWYDTLYSFKNQFPKNKLIKNMMTTL
jgi:hypothetical protein